MKSQISTLDLIISLLIMSIVLVFSVKQLTTLFQDKEFSSLSSEAVRISNYLLSEGFPKNWTNTTVIRIGLMTNNRINTTKLEQFMNMSYNLTKGYLNAFHYYAVEFSNSSGPLKAINCSKAPDFIEACNITDSLIALKPKNIVRIDRLAVYNKSIIKVVVYEWT